ncbi:MAG: RHS repeat-associated core domain-containing protein [Oligoflexus sp.]
MRYCCGVLIAIIFSVLSSIASARDAFLEDRIQAPQLNVPGRSSIIGDYASGFELGTSLARGDITIPLLTPEESRAPIIVNPFPTWSAVNGLSEWGMGWSAQLNIKRFNLKGEFDYQTDLFSSRFGILQQADDGYFYPQNLTQRVRVHFNADKAIAYLPDGSIHTYQAFDSYQEKYSEFFLIEAASKEGFITRFEFSKPDIRETPRLNKVVSGLRMSHPGLYEWQFSYEEVPNPTTTFEFGYPTKRSFRISQIDFLHINGDESSLRQRFELNYFDDQLGVAYYLKSLKKTYASGSEDPLVTFKYDLPLEFFESIGIQESDVLQELIRSIGPANFSPKKISIFDEDLDGKSEIEFAHDYSIWRLSGDTYVKTKVTAANDRDFRCRRNTSNSNQSRYISRLTPNGTPYVIVRQSSTDGNFLVVCHLDGSLVDATKLQQNLSESPNVKVTDINRDGRIDFVKFLGNTARIYLNISNGDEIIFEEHVIDVKASIMMGNRIYLTDMNGDGHVDIVSVKNTALEIVYGTGNLGFTTESDVVPFENQFASPLLVRSFDLTFLDFNRDGLSDVILTNKDRYIFIANQGGKLREFRLPQLERNAFVGNIFIADLLGKGNLQILKNRFNGTVSYLDLGRASTSLLTQIDDGRGNQFDLEWQFAEASTGVSQRPVVLKKITRQISGKQSEAIAFSYKNPIPYSFRPSFIGFGEVTQASKDLVTIDQYLHADEFRNLPVFHSSNSNYSPDIKRFKKHSYRNQYFQGLNIKFPSTVITGYSDPSANDADLVTVSSIDSINENFCPLKEKNSRNLSSLVSLFDYQDLPEFELHMTCWPSINSIVGRHLKFPEFDFEYQLHFERNHIGQVQELSVSSQQKKLALQSLQYDEMSRLKKISDSTGSHISFDYFSHSELLQSSIDASGVVSKVLDRNLADLATVTSTIRNDSRFDDFYSYDSRERLSKIWNNLYSSSENDPISRFNYRDANNVQPGFIQTTLMKDQHSSSSIIDLFSSDGSILSTLKEVDEGFASQVLHQYFNQKNLERKFHTNEIVDQPKEMNYADLYQDAFQIAEKLTDSLGFYSHQKHHYQEDVEGSVQEKWTINSSLSVIELSKNESGFKHSQHFDELLNKVRHTNELGETFHYRYDALNRLRMIEMPSGKVQKITFDEFSRPKKINRSEVGSIEFTYDDKRNQLIEKKYFGVGEVLDRYETYAYDSIGRLTETNYFKGPSRKTISRTYDGVKPEHGDQLGFLSQVKGEHYTKSFSYQVDGKLQNSQFDFPGFKTIVKSFSYYRDGDLESKNVDVLDLNGRKQSSYMIKYSYDNLNRLSHVSLDSGDVLNLQYDRFGRLKVIQVNNESVTELVRDPRTFVVTGRIVKKSGKPELKYSFGYNSRGSLGFEVFGEGDVLKRKNYVYNENHFLDSYSVEGQNFSFAYDTDGLTLQVESPEHQVSLKDAFDPNILNLDKLNRVLSKKDFQFYYGSSGHLEKAVSDQSKIVFFYDESGTRNLKLKNDALVYLKADEVWVTDQDVFELIEIDNMVVAAIWNGRLFPLFTDSRNSLLAGVDGNLIDVFPYGNVEASDRFSKFVSYAKHSLDDDLGLVRMGVRDYDPEIGRFLTADPYFLENADECVLSPVECNLYSYAKNNPLKYTDPTGMYIDENGQNHIGPANPDPSFRQFADYEAYNFHQNYGDIDGFQVAGSSGYDLKGAFDSASAMSKLQALSRDIPILGAAVDMVIGGAAGKVLGFVGGKIAAKISTKSSFSQLRTALNTGSKVYKGTTRLGHALSKHSGRKPQIWGKMSGNQKGWHDQAMKHFREIVRSPGSFQKVNSNGINFLEKRLPDGRGVRLNMDNTFKGFID